MASSEDSRKGAAQDPSKGKRIEELAGAQPSAGGAEAPWGGNPDYDNDATQVRGQPQWTSSDPTGFGETTQAVPRPQLSDPSGDETHVGPGPSGSNFDSSAETSPAAQMPTGGDWGDSSADSPVPGPTTSSELPAHLQLPNIDFSFPMSSGSGVSGSIGSTPPDGDSSVPAHLQLPNFPDLGLPDLGLPPTPAEEPPAAAASAPPAMSRRSAPPPPPPPRRKGGGDHPPPSDVPPPPEDDLSLPDLAPPPAKRNLTLINMPQPDEDDAPRRSFWPFVAAAVAVAVAIGAFVERERLFALVAPKRTVNRPAPTPHDLAAAAFAEGYKAFTSKDYPTAVGDFERALNLDPSYYDAHRSLGIVFATTHEQAKAIEHYKKYLELNPKAPDVGEVQKIIDDYNKAQAKAAPPPPPAAAPAEAEEKGGKKGHTKHHGKH